MLLSIDPGIGNFGLSVIDHSCDFKVIDTVNVRLVKKLSEENKILEKKYSLRTVRVLNILKTVNEYIDTYKPTMVTIEAPFYHSLTPMAYSALLEVIFAIKYNILIPKDLPFKLIEPLLIKKLFTSNSLASKDLIKQFLITKIADKDIFMEKDIELLSEHEIDSIAIGYVFVKFFDQFQSSN